jgi:hypothetical protein
LFKPGTGALSAPGPASYKSWGATGQSRRAFFDFESSSLRRCRNASARRAPADDSLRAEPENPEIIIPRLPPSRECGIVGIGSAKTSYR